MISHVTASRFPPPSVYMMDDDESEVESLNFLPENLRDSLLDFQKQGVKFGIRNKGRYVAISVVLSIHFLAISWPSFR